MKRASLRQLTGIAAVLAVAGVAALMTSPEALFSSAERLAERPAVFAVVVVAAYLLRPLLAWPISALSILLGYVLGPAAVPVALAGAVVTALPAYAVARYLGHDAGLLARVGDAGTAAGEAPWVVAAVLLGASAGELTRAGLSAGPLVVVTAVALAALLALSGPAYRRVSGSDADALRR